MEQGYLYERYFSQPHYCDWINESTLGKITIGLKVKPAQDLVTSFKKHSHPGLMNALKSCKDADDVRYMKKDISNSIRTLEIISQRVKYFSTHDPDPEDETEIKICKYIRKHYIDKGVKYTDVDAYAKWLKDKFIPACNSRLKELKK